jgi:type I restriction enzyme S subunit
LSEIAEIKRGAASQHLNYVEKNHPNAIRLIRINDFLNDEAVFVEDTSDIKRFRVKTGDILIAGTGATAGITFIIDSKFNDLAYSYNAPRIRVEKANNQFVYQYLKSDSIIKQQRRLFVGNAQPFLDITTIGNFKLFIPSLPEQQKIASCLLSLDDLITAQTQKIEQLQWHKKGLLQGLFPNMNEHHG